MHPCGKHRGQRIEDAYGESPPPPALLDVPIAAKRCGQSSAKVRDHCVPPAVVEAMRQAVRPVPCDKETGLRQKHATPLATAETVSVALNEVRPAARFEDRKSRTIVPEDVIQLLALRKHYVLDVDTGKKFVDQWNSVYFPTTFPYSIPRVVSGPGSPWKKRERRLDDAPILEPMAFARLLASRVEASVRNDWLAAPTARNIGLKSQALCGDGAACRFPVDPDKARLELVADLTEAAKTLYDKFLAGHWWDGRTKTEDQS